MAICLPKHELVEEGVLSVIRNPKHNFELRNLSAPLLLSGPLMTHSSCLRGTVSSVILLPFNLYAHVLGCPLSRLRQLAKLDEDYDTR